MTDNTINWGGVRLVAFDVDGTLYCQRTMRQRMLGELVRHSMRSRSLRAAKILRAYRRSREIIGSKETFGFEEILVEQTAAATHVSTCAVREVVDEWICKRPLAHIRACRLPNVKELFTALKRQGKIIGIFSDYPAAEKMAALELSADYVVAAGDKSVNVLKPHPRGLQYLMSTANVRPVETIFVGDRIEKDGAAARRAGVKALIRSKRTVNGWPTFSNFTDKIFAPVYVQSTSHHTPN